MLQQVVKTLIKPPQVFVILHATLNLAKTTEKHYTLLHVRIYLLSSPPRKFVCRNSLSNEYPKTKSNVGIIDTCRTVIPIE